MIAPQANIFFYILVVALYFLIILLTAKRFNFFVYLGSLKFIQKLNAKIRLEKFRTFNNSISNKIKPALLPLINISGLALETLSSGLNKAETKTTIFISKNFIEAITFTGLIARKTINAEINSIWAVLFVIIVVIYFILTNF